MAWMLLEFSIFTKRAYLPPIPMRLVDKWGSTVTSYGGYIAIPVRRILFFFCSLGDEDFFLCSKVRKFNLVHISTSLLIPVLIIMLDLWSSRHRSNQQRRCNIALVVASLFLCLQQLPGTIAGFVKYDLILEPTPELVRFFDGYLRGPGFIDLGSLNFTAVSPAIHAAATDDDFRLFAGTEWLDDSVVDVAIFRLPEECAHKQSGCDWPSLGVGKRAPNGGLLWCCNDGAAALHLCNFSSYGRLLVVDGKFQGNHREIVIPRKGNVSTHMKYGKMDQKESGHYVVLFANCNDYGREILVNGVLVWKSVHGYLPGELYGFVFMNFTFAVVYLVLWFWYGYAMKVNYAHRIEIEKWIMLAISLGLLERFFLTLFYLHWNVEGSRSTFIFGTGKITGVLKQGISRCLIVMASLGWGVVRDSRVTTKLIIVVLGSAYIIVSAWWDSMVTFHPQVLITLLHTKEQKIVFVLLFLSQLFTFIFIFWTFCALNNTAFYLKFMNQTHKLGRFNKLRCLCLFSILFAIIWFVFLGVNKVAKEHLWVIHAGSEINYLFLLVGVAYLWKPNPNMHEYANVMELPSMGADGENGLELTPSAANGGSEDFGNGKNGFHDKNNEGFHDDLDNCHDGRFQIT
jgi:Lung seven transmembrane receptor